MVFAALRRASKPSEAEAYQAIRARLDGNACQTHARGVMPDAARFGWPLAYALAWAVGIRGQLGHASLGSISVFRRRGGWCAGCATPPAQTRSVSGCRERHDPHRELRRWFGFDDFRPEPRDDDAGQPMQQSVVEAAMRGEHVLAVLPTGSGKSLCYQVPALSRYDKTGALTVVISPLVRAHGRPGQRPRGAGHRFVCDHQWAPVHAGASRRIGKGPPRRCRYPHHLS